VHSASITRTCWTGAHMPTKDTLSQKNCQKRDGRFQVLGLASVTLPGPWWWHTEDIDDPAAQGSIFRAYELPNDQELAHANTGDCSLEKWMHSHLNQDGRAKALVTAYIVNEGGELKQHVQARMTSRDRKVILGCCFMVSRAEELAAPIFNVLRGATLL
jgi:hypothetical protein